MNRHNPILCGVALIGVIVSLILMWMSDVIWMACLTLTFSSLGYCLVEYVAPLFGCIDCPTCAGTGKVVRRQNPEPSEER